MPINYADVDRTMDALYDQTMQNYANNSLRKPPQWKRFMKEQKVKRLFQTTRMNEAMGVATQREEGSIPVEVAPNSGWVKRGTVRSYGAVIVLTVEGLNYGDPKRVSEAMQQVPGTFDQAEELTAAALYDYGTSALSAVPLLANGAPAVDPTSADQNKTTGVQNSWMNKSHTWLSSQATYANLRDYAEPNETTLLSVIEEMNNTWTDSIGAKLDVQVETIVATTTTFHPALRLVLTPKQLGTFNNDVNLTQQYMGKADVLMWPQLNVKNAWYITTNLPGGPTRYRLSGIEKQPEDGHASAGIREYAWFQYYGDWVVDPHGAYAIRG